ncbi:hypothetical protein [Alloscardovia theropitheci]|nr:hypothetical protein [Alloscardovia theropitheci]
MNRSVLDASLMDDKGESAEFFEQQHQLLEQVYLTDIEQMIDSVVNQLNKDLSKRMQDAVTSLRSHERSIDAAIEGEASEVIRDDVDAWVKQLDSVING